MTQSAVPDAVILACWASEDPLLAQIEVNSAIIPMGEKPMVQRVLEKLIALGCKRIAIVHGDRPQAIEALLGDGGRWGCAITHHYATEGNRPLGVLTQIVAEQSGNCALAPADTIALTDLERDKPCVLGSQVGAELIWTGWAIVSVTTLRTLAQTVQSEVELGRRLLASDDLPRGELRVAKTISTATVTAALDSLPLLIEKSPSAEGIHRRPQSEGVWVGNGSWVHPSARLRPPVFIGQNVRVAENATIGPNAAIGDGCIIDAGSHIEDSLLLRNTYVGQKLEVVRSLLSGNHLINARLGVAVRIPDPEFLRGISRGDHRHHGGPLNQRILAALLWPALAPLGALWRLGSSGRSGLASASIGVPGPVADDYRLVNVHFAMSHEGVHAGLSGAWKRHFLFTFLPGLRDAIAGRVALIGLQPRAVAEITALPDYWQQLYRSNPAGLVGEALLLDGLDVDSPEMRYAGDVLSAGKLPLRRVLHLLKRYAARVTADAPAPISDQSASHPTP